MILKKFCKFKPYAHWQEQCHNEVLIDEEYCKKHIGLRCQNPGCNNQALAEFIIGSSIWCGACFCEECGYHFIHGK